MRCRVNLSTRLASRAVHIEGATSMAADSFLNANHNFICRSPIRELHWREDRTGKDHTENG